MPSLGSLWYQLGIKDMTDADLQKINARLKSLGSDIQLIPKIDKDAAQNAVPKGIKIELTPSVTNDALAKAVEGKVMKVEVTPLITHLRKALKDATTQAPVEAEIGPNATKLRNLITDVLNRHGYMVNINTVNDNYTKVVQQKLNGTSYKVKIHADAREIAQSVQASLMQVQSRHFGLQVSRDILYRSIDEALGQKRFSINIAVQHDQARRAVQDALLRAQVIGKDQALAYQRLQTGELRAAQAELARLKAEHYGAAGAAKAHASASVNLGGAMGSNIRIAGELGSAMASMYSIHAAKQFLSQVIEIGGELEHQKIALETIYGSESKMQSLFAQVKGLARQSPFGVMDLTKNIKQLSAYGVAYNEVYDTAKRLADISAATSVDINRLILAFGKTKNRTFLDGLEAKQFAYANIPIYDMLSKKLTELEGKFVSVKDVMGRIKKREIGFDMVKEILWDMTDEGGKFYNMQEKLAGSVKTSWKLVRDNIELMFGEIAESGVGEWLKNVGQTMQELTRSWKSFSTIIATGAVAFGVYKLAVAGTNILLDKQVGSIAANHIAEKQLQAAKLRSIGITTPLSASEKELIATRNKLTATDLEYLFVEKGLANEEIKRLFLSGKITRAELQKAVALGVLTQKEFEQIAGTNALNGAWLRFNATLHGTWATIKAGAASAFGLIFNWATAAFAAIAGLVYLYQHNQREDEIGAEFSKNWKQRGEDMAKSMSDALAKPFENLSAPEASQLIDEYKNLIKDFATLPDDVIQRAIFDKDGNIRNTADQIKYLREELESLKKTAESMSTDLGTIISATGDGVFKEDIVTNLKDYAGAYNKANAIYLKFVTDHKDKAREIVEAARNADAGFAKEIANAKTLAEEFTILMRNRAQYEDAWEAAEETGGFWATRGGSFLGSWKLWNTTSMEASVKEMSAYRQAMSDIASGINQFKELHEDWDWGNLSEAQSEEVRQFYKKLIEQSEISAPELKQTVADTFQDAFKVKIVTDKTEDDWIKNAQSAMKNCMDEATKEALRVLQYDGADKLTTEQRNLVKKLFKTADDETKKQLPDLFSNAQSWINQHSLFWRIRYFFDNKEGKLSQAAQDLIDSKGGTSKLSTITTDLIKEVDGEGKSIFDIRNALKEKRQEAKNKIDADIKAGLSEASETFKADKLAYDNVEKALNELDWTDLATKDQKSNKEPKGRTSQKDMFAEGLKQRFKDIKDAWSEFQKWSKTEGREAAATRIAESGLFSTLPKDKIPQTVEQYRALVVELENELRKAGVKGTARESLLNDLLKHLLDIDNTVVDEQLNKAKERIDATIKDLTRKWDFHKQLFELTGDRETSIKLAFGEDVAWQTQSQMLESVLNTQLAERGLDVPLTISDEEAKEKLKGTPLYDLLWKPTKEAKLKEEVELQINVAKAVADTASTADKIKVQERLRDTAVKEYRASEAFKEYGEEGAEAVAKPFNDKILELKSTMLQLLPVWEQIFGDREYASMKQLEQGMNAAQGIIDNAKIHYNKDGKADYFTSVVVNDDGSKQEIQGNISLLEKLKKAVVSLNKEAGKLNPFKRLADTLKEVFSKPKDGEKGDDTETKLRKLGAAVSEVADMTGSLAGQLAEAFDAIGNDGMAQAMTDAQDVMNTVSNIGKGFAEGGLVGGIAAAAGEAIGWVTKAFQASARHKEALRAIMNETLAQQREYNLLLMQQNLEYKKAATILGEDTYGKAKNAVKVMKDAYKDLQDELAGTAEQQGNERRKANSSRMFARMFGLGFDEAKAKLRQAYAGLADIEIKTGHKKTGLFGWGKGKDIYSSILDVYPDLIDANGKFNSSLAETIINTRVMSDEDKAAFQNMIDLAEQAEAAYEELNSYMTDIFGELGSSMTDALVSAFANGSNAAEDFCDSVSDILEALAKQMIYSVTLAPLIEEAQKKMMDVMQNDTMSDEQKFGTWTGILDGLLDDALKQQGVANDLFKKYQDMAAEKGFDIFKPDEDSKSGLSAGIQSVTEDTADLLASYLNAVRADVATQTFEHWPKLLNEALPQMNVIAESQLKMQQQIAANTLRNAIAAEAIVKSNDEINRLLTRATQGGTKFYIH